MFDLNKVSPNIFLSNICEFAPHEKLLIERNCSLSNLVPFPIPLKKLFLFSPGKIPFSLGHLA
jgi:hypothetical protein